MEIKIGVVGLGYVGLPLALAFADEFAGTVGFDVDAARVAALRRGEDPTREGLAERIGASAGLFSSDLADLRGCNFFVIGVPTPIDLYKRPDLSCLERACTDLGTILQPGATVVFESTVYPGVTEDICGPLLEQSSGLKRGRDFKLAYSPERINPGDKVHTLPNIIKVVSGEDPETLALVAKIYGRIIKAGIFAAASIKIAEAAKVIENTQRDLNIALMNELALIFDLMGIDTRAVLDAAASKWNFLRFAPGLVGGHCIGVDPYYLTTKAELLGYRPQVILAGRRINDGMGHYLGQRMVKLLVHQGKHVKGARVGILGVTFKENVADIRNSRVPDIVAELAEFGVTCLVYDPVADPVAVQEHFGLSLVGWQELSGIDGLICAVIHDEFRDLPEHTLVKLLNDDGVFMDVKSAFRRECFGPAVGYWNL